MRAVPAAAAALAACALALAAPRAPALPAGYFVDSTQVSAHPVARPLFRSGLVYRALIAPQDTFALADSTLHDVYVAELSLTWTFDDGTFVPRVEADRTVVFSRDGGILAIEGDGGARETATISAHRGIGRKEQILR